MKFTSEQFITHLNAICNKWLAKCVLYRDKYKKYIASIRQGRDYFPPEYQLDLVMFSSIQEQLTAIQGKVYNTVNPEKVDYKLEYTILMQECSDLVFELSKLNHRVTFKVRMNRSFNANRPALSTRSFSKKNAATLSSDCCICLDTELNITNIVMFNCNHVCCATCTKSLFSTSKCSEKRTHLISCPLCRSVVTKVILPYISSRAHKINASTIIESERAAMMRPYCK